MPTPPYQASGPRRRPILGWSIGACVVLAVVLVAALAIIVAADRKDDKSSQGRVATPSTATPPTPLNTLTTPSSVGPYKLQTGNIARRLVTEMRQQMEKTGPPEPGASDKVKAALYSNGDDQLIFIGLPGKDIPSLAAELRKRSASASVDQMFYGAGYSDADDYPAGPLGGALRCGKSKQGVAFAMCAWADQSTMAMVIGPQMSLQKLAPLTLTLRNAAEHAV